MLQKTDPETFNNLKYLNPLRYRGYVYDTETQFYYLQSRYYDPEIARFINSDSYASTGQGILGNNMFAYCNNNPIVHYDITGEKIVAVGFQLDIQVGDVCIGVEIVIYFDDEICDGEDYAIVAYTYSGASVSMDELTDLVSTVEKETTMIIAELGSQDIDVLLFALKSIMDDNGMSGAVFVINANSEFTEFEDYSGSFDTFTGTVEIGGIDYSIFRSSCDTCVSYGLKVGISPSPKRWWWPFDISYSRTYYSEPMVLVG